MSSKKFMSSHKFIINPLKIDSCGFAVCGSHHVPQQLTEANGSTSSRFTDNSRYHCLEVSFSGSLTCFRLFSQDFRVRVNKGGCRQAALKAEVNSGMTAYHRQGAVLGQIQMWSKPAVPNPFPRHGPVYIGQYFDAFKVSQINPTK